VPNRPVNVLFDATHGQPNWSQTGFTSRELHSNYFGLARLLQELGYICRVHRAGPLGAGLRETRLLVIPPPTGTYDWRYERWLHDPGSLFSPADIETILRYLLFGGRLLAFAYRFGDDFTRTNLGDLFQPLGCGLNNDAVIEPAQLREASALESRICTHADFLPSIWAREGVTQVLWHSTATFSITPNAILQPLAMSPGGRCIAFDRKERLISFQSLPIAVAGTYGEGRFALFGGPHVVETGAFGLLTQADNRRFAANVIGWLLGDEPLAAQPSTANEQRLLAQEIDSRWLDACRIRAQGGAGSLVDAVERYLDQTGILKALNHGRWAT
jgi:hypothetical protein